MTRFEPTRAGIINIFEYAFNTNPNLSNSAPVSVAITNDHLTVTFKRAHPAPEDITWLFEVTDDLVAGNWQAGPAFTQQAITDNLDGTETVVVTDNANVSSSPVHYLRVRISYP